MSTILIVEDHAMSREALKALLGYYGHRLLEAADGAAALKLARAEHPDLIITDIVMPTMDGIEFIRQLRADKKLVKTPVIVYTATYRMGEAHRMVEGFGACNVIPKPSEPSVILHAVNEILGISPSEAALPPVTGAPFGASKYDPFRCSGIQLATLIDLGSHLVSQQDPERLLEIFCSAIRSLLNCRHIRLALTGEKGQTRYFGEDKEDRGKGPGEKNSKFKIQNELSLDPHDIEQVVSRRRTIRRHAPESFMALPFATPGRVYGWFCLADKLDHLPFGEQDEEMAVALSAQAASAYENLLLVEEIKESQRFSRRIADATPNILYIFDVMEHKLVYANDALYRTLGYTLNDIQKLGGSLYQELIHPEDLVKIDEARKLDLLRNEENILDLEFRVKHSSGEWRWLLTRNVLFSRTEDGLLKQVLGSIQDITGPKQTEEELKRTVHELERSNRELEQFAYIASHDLREPLRMISSYLKLIERRYKGRLDKDADEFIDFAVNGAEYMQTLLRELLAFSRLGKETELFAPTDLNKVFKRAFDNLKNAIEESGAEVICEKLPSVYAHELQMVQLFQNFIGNAIKFRRDKPVVRVSAERLRDGWLIQVCDNGIGIAPEHFDRIFFLFKRLHARDRYPGTGMGLAICKKIVESHGGRIWVVSEPGIGSTFYFTIPDKK